MSEQKKITIKEANDFQFAASVYLTQHKEESKFTYALKKVQKRIDKAAEKPKEDYNEKVIDNNVRLASTDKDGNILYEVETVIEANGSKKEVNTGTPKFKPESLREKNKLQNELGKIFLDTVIEFEPYMATEVPELTEEEKEAFNGYVISVEGV